jgi:enediyne biosynthesis protein E3
MQDLFEFLTSCKHKLSYASAFSRLHKDAPTPKRKIVDDLMDMFTTGYNAALETDPETLAKHIAGVDFIERSVMLEGSYAAVASMDLKQGANWVKLQELMAVASDSVIAINEGIGHALCQQRMQIDFIPKVTSTFWGWMAIDGFGCHAGYFRWPEVIGRQEIPAYLDEIGLRAFDQGVGRAIWLIGAADPKTIDSIISKFPKIRRADLWSGVGMMIGFWGADDSRDMRRFLIASGRWRPWLQLGVAFAAMGRLQANQVTDFTREACRMICESNDTEAIGIATKCLESLESPPDDSHKFNQWKNLIASEYSSH